MLELKALEQQTRLPEREPVEESFFTDFFGVEDNNAHLPIQVTVEVDGSVEKGKDWIKGVKRFKKTALYKASKANGIHWAPAYHYENKMVYKVGTAAALFAMGAGVVSWYLLQKKRSESIK